MSEQPGKCHLSVVKPEYKDRIVRSIGVFPKSQILKEFYKENKHMFSTTSVDMEVVGSFIHIKGPGTYLIEDLPDDYLVGNKHGSQEILHKHLFKTGWDGTPFSWTQITNILPVSATVWYQTTDKLLYLSCEEVPGRTGKLSQVMLDNKHLKVTIMPIGFTRLEYNFVCKMLHISSLRASSEIDLDQLIEDNMAFITIAKKSDTLVIPRFISHNFLHFSDDKDFDNKKVKGPTEPVVRRILTYILLNEFPNGVYNPYYSQLLSEVQTEELDSVMNDIRELNLEVPQLKFDVLNWISGAEQHLSVELNGEELTLEDYDELDRYEELEQPQEPENLVQEDWHSKYKNISPEEANEIMRANLEKTNKVRVYKSEESKPVINENEREEVELNLKRKGFSETDILSYLKAFRPDLLDEEDRPVMEETQTSLFSDEDLQKHYEVFIKPYEGVAEDEEEEAIEPTSENSSSYVPLSSDELKNLQLKQMKPVERVEPIALQSAIWSSDDYKNFLNRPLVSTLSTGLSTTQSNQLVKRVFTKPTIRVEDVVVENPFFEYIAETSEDQESEDPKEEKEETPSDHKLAKIVNKVIPEKKEGEIEENEDNWADGKRLVTLQLKVKNKKNKSRAKPFPMTVFDSLVDSNSTFAMAAGFIESKKREAAKKIAKESWEGNRTLESLAILCFVAFSEENYSDCIDLCQIYINETHGPTAEVEVEYTRMVQVIKIMAAAILARDYEVSNLRVWCKENLTRASRDQLRNILDNRGYTL